MSQDIIADVLNEIMNGKRNRKNSVQVKRYSKLLIEVLNLAKKHGYIEEYKAGKELEIKFKLNKCKAVKPRFYASINQLDKYIKRFLPARDFGILIISTNKGLITQEEAYEKNIGGSLIAYFY